MKYTAGLDELCPECGQPECECIPDTFDAWISQQKPSLVSLKGAWNAGVRSQEPRINSLILDIQEVLPVIKASCNCCPTKKFCDTCSQKQLIDKLEGLCQEYKKDK